MFNKGAKRENVINLVIHLMYKSAFYYVGNYRISIHSDLLKTINGRL